MFGKRQEPFRGSGSIPRPPVDSDGKRRVFGEAIFAGEHGDMLRTLGLNLDDETNIIPDEAEFDRRIKDSLARQDMRRTKIEGDLLRTHGHNAIRPFFILAEPVFNSELGQWLIRHMKLLPYDDWNIVYLPMDRQTQVAMGGLPLHPRQSIGPIDTLMVEQVGTYFSQYQDARRKVDLHIEQVGVHAAMDLMGRFTDYVDALPQKILDHVGRVRPMIIDLIADVQSKNA